VTAPDSSPDAVPPTATAVRNSPRVCESQPEALLVDHQCRAPPEERDPSPVARSPARVEPHRRQPGNQRAGPNVRQRRDPAERP
jgi:hypothetical protein